MAGDDPTRGGLLDLAVSAAHRALHRLDEDDVPAPLRSVRETAVKRRLPPPLAVRLIDELEQGWLRDLALDELGDGDSDRHIAARVFLERPARWEDQLDLMEARRRSAAAEAEIERLRRETRELQDRVDRLSARLGESERSVAAAVADAVRALEADRDRLRRRIRELERAVVDSASEVADREGSLDQMEDELADADRRIAVLRERQARAELATGAPGDTTSFGRGAPLDLARHLDELGAAVRPPAEVTTPPPSTAPDTTALPAGVRPDSSDAIGWVLSLQRPTTVLVDGHNVAFDLARDPDRHVRDRLVAAVASLRRHAAGPMSPTVFFDTDLTEEAIRSRGVTVRYVTVADDEIAAAAEASDGVVIVVSTDRDVRRRAENHGAVALWGTALSEWIRRG